MTKRRRRRYHERRTEVKNGRFRERRTEVKNGRFRDGNGSLLIFQRFCQEKYTFPDSRFFYPKKGLQADLQALFSCLLRVRKRMIFLTAF